MAASKKKSFLNGSPRERSSRSEGIRLTWSRCCSTHLRGRSDRSCRRQSLAQTATQTIYPPQRSLQILPARSAQRPLPSQETQSKPDKSFALSVPYPRFHPKNARVYSGSASHRRRRQPSSRRCARRRGESARAFRTPAQPKSKKPVSVAAQVEGRSGTAPRPTIPPTQHSLRAPHRTIGYFST